MIEREIETALVHLQKAIAGADGAGISAAIARLDELRETRRQEIDGQLRHFLKNRSYEKALQYIRGAESIPAGNCS